MDDPRFDDLVTHFHVVRNRRQGFGVLLAGLGAVVGRLATPDGVAACRRRRKRCKRDGECCSGRCTPRTNTSSDKVCQCSQLQERCRGHRDCCGNRLEICGRNACATGRFCCVREDLPCDFDCDCCGALVCGGVARTCQPRTCSDTQEACGSSDDCCADMDLCANVFGDCGAAGTVCCRGEGAACRDDCDCCGALQCSGIGCVLA